MKKRLHGLLCLIFLAWLASCGVSDDTTLDRTSAVEAALNEQCTGDTETNPTALRDVGLEDAEEEAAALCPDEDDPPSKRARCHTFCSEWGCDYCCAGRGWIWCEAI